MENINLYDGCKQLKKIDSLESDSILSPEAFFNQYITTRTPVLFNSFPSDSDWLVNKPGRVWSNHYLRSKVPKEEFLKIEKRDNSEDRFGKGNEIKMSFHTFLDKIDRGDQGYYLTTQELEYDEEGQPYIMTAPALYLQKDFPLIPNIFRNLIISNVNIWYGQSKTSSTSGLHHDYHDNLYVLLKGEKTITLISPVEAPNLYTVGTLTKIHHNGRINYEGQATFADGRDLKADKAFQAAKQLEDLTRKLEEKSPSKKATQSSSSSAKANIKRANYNDEEEEDDDDEYQGIKFDNDSDDEIDRALDAVLDAEIDSDAEDEEDWEDDEDGDMNGAFIGDSSDDNEDDDEEEEESVDKTKRKRGTLSAAKADKNLPLKKQKKEFPDNFSQVDTSIDDRILSQIFPKYLGARKNSITVTIKAGQMLYIPCGWFHEVKSKGEEGHIALNYWFHPPDQKSFDKPYESEFWPKTWEFRKSMPSRPID